MIGLVFGGGFSVVEAIDQQCPCSAIILDTFFLLLLFFLFVFEITLYSLSLSLRV